jgi:hypothetical protein
VKAQWKTEYGFGIDTASIHQRLWQGFIFMGIALGSLNYSKTTPRKILCSGTFISIIGYFILILAKYAPLQEMRHKFIYYLVFIFKFIQNWTILIFKTVIFVRQTWANQPIRSICKQNP